MMLRRDISYDEAEAKAHSRAWTGPHRVGGLWLLQLVSNPIPVGWPPQPSTG